MLKWIVAHITIIGLKLNQQGWR